MNIAALSRPDADEFLTLDFEPAGELEDCNHLLDDHAALMRFYDDNGYILLRGVLNMESVHEARDSMLEVAARHGLVRSGDIGGKWTGVALDFKPEESVEFSGISNRLIEKNLDVMERVLGEPACTVPIVQYRIYPPNGPATMPHQDGFYSPGIHDYKPVWVPLTPCSRDMGGLSLAVGQNNRGYFHNLAKANPFPMVKSEIPEDSWATTNYMPGDALFVHPYTPHGTRPNKSDRLRVTFDTRVQSASRPSAFVANIVSATKDTITVAGDDGEQRTFRVDEKSYIRIADPSKRIEFSEFVESAVPGRRIVLVSDGGQYAVMMRKAAEG